jgi:hypothetical protein
MKRPTLKQLFGFARPLADRLGLRGFGALRAARPARGRRELECVSKILKSPITIALLGSQSDVLAVPCELARHVRIWSVDAVSPGMQGDAREQGPQVFPLSCVVAPETGPVEFREHASSCCSSVLLPRESSIAAYGLEENFRLVQKTRVAGTSLSELADRNGLTTWRLIKTDLEGLDFAVVKGLGERLRGTLVLEMELRFEPFYEGEPRMAEVLAYLHGFGFEVLDLSLERWRYRTAHHVRSRRGHVAFCNVHFVNRSITPAAEEDFVAQVLLLGLLGHTNFAEMLLESAADMPARLREELLDFLFPAEHERDLYLPFPDYPHVTTPVG